MREKDGNNQGMRKVWIEILSFLHEAIPNKIKWDIDELVLKVNDLLRTADDQQVISYSIKFSLSLSFLNLG